MLTVVEPLGCLVLAQHLQEPHSKPYLHHAKKQMKRVAGKGAEACMYSLGRALLPAHTQLHVAGTSLTEGCVCRTA